MRYVKVMDNIAEGIVRDGNPDLGPGYAGTTDINEADAILIRASSIHGLDIPDNVRCIARSGAGYNNIPVEECARRGIVVFNAPGGNSNAVKEIVVGMMLACSRDTLESIAWVEKNKDAEDIVDLAEKNKKAFVGRELYRRRVGVVGLGAVGSKVANALVSMGMEVYGYDPYVSVEHAWQLSRAVRRVGSLDDLCHKAEYVTLHVPSKEDTVHMIGEKQLSLMARGAMLLNYARADIVDEPAVAAALESGQLSRFICDFATPGTVAMKNTIITPHMGACTGEAEENCAHMVISQMKEYLETGNIANSVNYPPCSLGPCRTGGRFAALHANRPNMIGQITAILADSSANIERMANEAAGTNAYTLVDTDKPLDRETYDRLRSIPNMWKVRVIKPAQ